MTGDSVSDTGSTKCAIDCAGRDGLGDGFAGVPQRVRHIADRGGEVTLGEVEQLRPVVAERIPGQIDGAEVLSHRCLGHRSEVAGIGFDVEQQSRDVHATDAIGERVVKLHHERRLAALEPLDERELPQRPITIEARHPGLASELQDGRQRLRGRRLEPADVPRQVEIGIDDPTRRGQPQRRRHDPVPKPRRQPRAALEPLRQPIPVRAAIQQQHAHDRRPQQRVLLHVPGERITVAHVHLNAL